MQDLESRSWEWRFDQPPDLVWPVVADTARFNEAAKLPKYQVEDVPAADGHVLRLDRAKVGGFPLEWEERPYEWVQNRSFRQTRLFRKGPLRRFGPVVELNADSGGTVLRYTLRAEPKGLMGALIFRLGFLESGGRAIGRLVKMAMEHFAGDQPQLFEYSPPSLPKGAAARRRAVLRGDPRRAAAAQLGPALPALPRRQARRLVARPAAQAGPLLV